MAWTEPVAAIGFPFAKRPARITLQLIAALIRPLLRQGLTALAPLLGNTVTEVTVPVPNQASVVRKSHLASLDLSW